MSVNSEFKHFIQSWQEKADGIEPTDIDGCFDRFFTLYVIYNRLYAEATFILARGGQPDLSKRTSFPDKCAATRYVSQYLKSTVILAGIQDSNESKRALEKIIGLVDEGAFFIRLDMVTGDSQREEDLKLLDALKSGDRCKKATAILETIYAIRCNMFHGHKGFHAVQKELLVPVIVLLEKIIELLWDKIESE